MFIYAINSQSSGVFACTPALMVARSGGRMTYWQCAPSVGLTTQLLQGTADYIFGLGGGDLGALKVFFSFFQRVSRGFGNHLVRIIYKPIVA